MSFWRISPTSLAQKIVSAAQEKVLSQRINKVTISVASAVAANSLIQVKSLVKTPVEVSVPISYTRNVGKIGVVPLEYTNVQLQEYFQDAGVIFARRQIACSRSEDATVLQRHRSSVVLTFRPDLFLSGRVKFCFNCFSLEEFCEGQTQCFKRQRFGHIARDCRGIQRCKV